MSARERTCLACEGTGAEMAPNSDYYHDDDGPICRVCRGDGRVSERIPASDAIADAETLRLLELPGVSLAEIAGEWAISWSRFEDRTGYRPRNDTSWNYKARDAASRAARAAFRAVPGLRG